MNRYTATNKVIADRYYKDFPRLGMELAELSNKKTEECKHRWVPFGDDAITSVTEYTPSCEIKYIYHWYCSKCNKTKTTESDWRTYN